MVGELTQAGVDHLINMKRLHTLELIIIGQSTKRYFNILDFIVALAGEIPSLQNFNFDGWFGLWNRYLFIEKFGEKYPNKVLTVNHLW